MTATPIRILATLCASILLTIVFAQTGQKIAKIETEGLQTLTSETVIATSGLKVGDAFSVEATDAAAERLVSSGLFKKVGYSTRNAGASVERCRYNDRFGPASMPSREISVHSR